MKYLESNVMWYTLDILTQCINTIYSTRLFTLGCASSSGVYLCLYSSYIGSISNTCTEADIGQCYDMVNNKVGEDVLKSLL